MAEATIQKAVCTRCGSQFNKDEESSDEEKLFCSRCVIELAEQYMSEDAKTQESDQIKKNRVWPVLHPVILIACIFLIAIQAPKLISVIKEQKPIRIGTYETDSKADRCIKNLWHISRMLQEGKLLEKDIVCPVSKKPYVLRKIEGDILVTCPNPELHGLKEIRATKIYPCPEVIK